MSWGDRPRSEYLPQVGEAAPVAAVPPARSRWAEVSPLLDELLDLPESDQEPRLAELQAQDPALAAVLRDLLSRQATAGQPQFLAQPAMPSEQALRQVPEALPSRQGQQLGAYLLEREIGEGGMGSVWQARRTDGRFEGRVAIKLLRHSLYTAAEAARFAREGRILGRLNHPHIARLLDAGVSHDTGASYLVLEYVEGLPIDQHCRQHQLGLPARLQLFLDVLAAVSHAHNRLILHRDLKPSNILVTDEGRVKLLDFGVAKLLAPSDPQGAAELTREAGAACTPHYAAPEQLQGTEVSTATDVYALGVLLYLLLCDQHPLADAPTGALHLRMPATEAPRPSEVLRRRKDAAAARLARAVAGDLDTVVAKAMALQPHARYANAAELADDLRRHLAHAPLRARPASAAYRTARFLRRHAAVVSSAVLVVAALAAAAALSLREARQADAQRQKAEGLIEFMLGDLRARLQPVGKLDVMDSLGEEALAYYARQPPTTDPDAQGRRARALHLLGEIAEQRGQLDAAAQRFQQAAQATAALLAHSPRDGQRVFDHAQSEYWLGFVDWRRGQLEAAETHFQRYLALARQLVQIAPQRDDWRTELAQAHHNLGVLYMGMARGQAAVAALQDSLRIWGSFARPGAALLLNQADTFGWLAVAQEAVGALDQALAARDAKLRLIERANAAQDQVDARATYLVAEAQHESGRVMLMLGRLAPARAQAAEAADAFQQLVAQDPANLNWLAGAAFARVGLAEAELALEHVEAARRQLQLAAPALRQLLQTDRSKAYWQIQLQGRWQVLQAEAADAPQLPAALEDLQGFLRQAREWQEAGHQPDPPQSLVLARAQLLAGDLLARLHRPDEAAAHWQAAPALLQALADQGNPAARTLLAQALLRLGLREQAQAWADQVEASAYRHPLYAGLQSQLAATASPLPAPAGR